MVKLSFVVKGKDKSSLASVDASILSLLECYIVRREINPISREYLLILKDMPENSIMEKIESIVCNKIDVQQIVL